MNKTKISFEASAAWYGGYRARLRAYVMTRDAMTSEVLRRTYGAPPVAPVPVQYNTIQGVNVNYRPLL